MLRHKHQSVLPVANFRNSIDQRACIMFSKDQNQDDKPEDWVDEGDVVVIGGQRFQRKSGGFTNMEVSPQEIEYNVQVELASLREGLHIPQDDDRFEDDEFEPEPAAAQASADTDPGRVGAQNSELTSETDAPLVIPGTAFSSPSQAVLLSA